MLLFFLLFSLSWAQNEWPSPTILNDSVWELLKWKSLNMKKTPCLSLYKSGSTCVISLSLTAATEQQTSFPNKFTKHSYCPFWPVVPNRSSCPKLMPLVEPEVHISDHSNNPSSVWKPAQSHCVYTFWDFSLQLAYMYLSQHIKLKYEKAL